MRFDSINLFYISLAMPVLLLILGWKLRWLGKICLVLAMLCSACAIGGLHLYKQRDLKIVALVDVSPSTRVAGFRKIESIQDRLKELTGGRPYSIQYFANGLSDKSQEVATSQTTLPAIDADAVLLLSDGQFDLPKTFPATYPIIDPAMEYPDDAKVIDIQFDNDIANIFTSGKLEKRSMSVEPATPNFINPNFISGMTVVKPDADKIRATLNSYDPWPENDRLTAFRVRGDRGMPLVVSKPSDLPSVISDYLVPSAIVIPSTISLSPLQISHLHDYVKTLGGSLILNGPPEDFQPELRVIAPVSHLPPEQKSKWIFLLDASGSMGQMVGNQSRFELSIQALQSALQRIDDDESVSLMTFNRRLNSIVENCKKSELQRYLAKLPSIQPTGETGLQSAIETSLLGAPSVTTRLVIISDGDADLKNPSKLTSELIKTKWTVYLLAIGENHPNPLVEQLCTSTGGFSSREQNPANWSAASNQLVKQALSNKPSQIDSPVQTSDDLSQTPLNFSLAYPAYLKKDAKTLASAKEQILIATWNAGSGKVSSIVGQTSQNDLLQIANRLRKVPSNPNYQITIDTIHNQLIVRLVTPGKTDVISMERMTGNQVKKSVLAIESPGVYKADLPRQEEPSIIVIRAGEDVIDRQPLSAHYPAEYDQIGNNRDNLKALADRTRGKIIEPDDNKPIEFPYREMWLDLTSIFAAGAFFWMLVAMLVIRLPYFLADRSIRRLEA